VLKLKPDDIDALLFRAELRLAEQDRVGAVADLDRLAATASKLADVRLRLGRLYLRADLPERALAEFDLWVASHPEEGEMAGALASRCRARVLANRELDRARADCDRALRLGPPTVEMYDSRALIFLRAGEYDRAIEDYNRVLAINPRLAIALYSRGVARLRKGLSAEGEADIAAAVAIQPRVAETARKLGIDRPASGPRPTPATEPPTVH
jgi:tetratricopeptide (TPR) repeat protein